MNAERWRAVKELFDLAADRPAAERAGFIREAAAGDAELERDIASLLASIGEAGTFLEEPAVERLRREIPIAVERPIPSRIGGYEILRELGHGGMGAVYLAERADPNFRQTVAVKVVRRGMDTDFILKRFQSERQILAALDHPNIARLLDGGSTEEGQPYFVMEYIPGSNLLEDCDARKFNTRERLILFRQLCAAVAYAHRNLVVHRDIKPSNILVTPFLVPKLLDFGLARILQPDAGQEADDRTETALRFLTPEYASPEQVRGERITTATDIYSLGVVLYELLTGHRPFRIAGRRPDEIARAISFEEPDRPSAAIFRTEETRRGGSSPVRVTPESVSATREGDPARLRRTLKGDLDNVVLVALRKEPERRYASVEQFADDIGRYLAGRPVRARKDTFAYRSGKFVGRHKAAVAAAALAVCLLVATGAAAIHQARVARRERAAAERSLADVRALTGSFLFEFHDAIRDLPGSTPARQLVVRRALEYLEKLSANRGGDRALQRELADAYERVARVQGGHYGSNLGDTDGARRSLLRALALREGLVRVDPSNASDRIALAESEIQLVQVLIAAGHPAAAAARGEHAVRTLDDLARAAPANRDVRFRLARARRYVGVALSSSGARDRALDELSASARALEELGASDPANAAYRRELGVTHQLTVYVLSGGTDREAAFQSYNRAVEIQEDLARADPGNFTLRRELSYTHMSMGAFLEWSGDVPAALAAYEKALPILESLVEADPRNADVRLALAEARNSVGYTQCRTGRLSPAREQLRKSLRLFNEVARSDPANARARLGLARLYESFGALAEAAASNGEPRARANSLREARDWYARSQTAYAALGEGLRGDRQIAREAAAVGEKLGAAARTLASLED